MVQATFPFGNWNDNLFWRACLFPVSKETPQRWYSLNPFRRDIIPENSRHRGRIAKFFDSIQGEDFSTFDIPWFLRDVLDNLGRIINSGNHLATWSQSAHLTKQSDGKIKETLTVP